MEEQSRYYDDPLIRQELENYPVIELGDGWYLHMIPENHPLTNEALDTDLGRLWVFQKAVQFGFNAHRSVRRERDDEVPDGITTKDMWNLYAVLAGIRKFYDLAQRLTDLNEAAEQVDRSAFIALHDRLRSPESGSFLTLNEDALVRLAQAHQLRFELTDEDVLEEIQFWRNMWNEVRAAAGKPPIEFKPLSWYTTQSVAEQVMPQEEGEGGTGGNLRMLGLPDANAVPHFTEYGGATYRHKVDNG